jgi:hypothetical protein
VGAQHDGLLIEGQGGGVLSELRAVAEVIRG